MRNQQLLRAVSNVEETLSLTSLLTPSSHETYRREPLNHRFLASTHQTHRPFPGHPHSIMSAWLKEEAAGWLGDAYSFCALRLVIMLWRDAVLAWDFPLPRPPRGARGLATTPRLDSAKGLSGCIAWTASTESAALAAVVESFRLGPPICAPLAKAIRCDSPNP